jgi:hypothetical protein
MATIISTKTTGVGGLSVTGDASGILQLASADGTTALTIDGSQNVGIGTSSVNSGNRLDVVKSVTTGDLTTQRHIRVGVDTNNNYSGFIGYGSPIAGQTGGLILQSYDNNIASNTYLNPNGGNVGIGTSSPSQKLEVSGASASTGNVNARVTNTQSAVSVDLAVTGSAYSYLNIPASGAYLYSTSSLSLANSSGNPITFITNSTERMRIDSAGRVTYSNNPAFITGSVSGGVTYTSGVKVNYSNNVYNRGSCWNSTNNYFVAPVAGYYFFKAQLWTYTGAAAAAYFRVNGSWRYGSFGNEATNIGFNGYAMVEMFYLAANDYVDVACRLGTVYTDSSFSTFSGYLIG